MWYTICDDTLLVSLDDQSSGSVPSSSSGTCLVAHSTTDIQTSSSSIPSSSFLSRVIKVSFGKVTKSFDLKITCGWETITRLQWARSLFKEAVDAAYLWTVRIFC